MNPRTTDAPTTRVKKLIEYCSTRRPMNHYIAAATKSPTDSTLAFCAPEAHTIEDALQLAEVYFTEKGYTGNVSVLPKDKVMPVISEQAEGILVQLGWEEFLGDEPDPEPLTNKKDTYQVVVGNIGTVYDGPDLDEAYRTFNEYKEKSQNNDGRCAGEGVTLFKPNDSQDIYEGTNHEE